MTSWALQVRWFTNVVAMLSLRVQDFNLQSSPCWWIVPVCSWKPISRAWSSRISVGGGTSGLFEALRLLFESGILGSEVNTYWLPKLYMRTAGWLFDLTLSLRRTDVVVRCAAHWHLPAAALQLCGCDCDDKEEKNWSKKHGSDYGCTSSPTTRLGLMKTFFWNSWDAFIHVFF